MTNPMPLFGTSEGDWNAFAIARDKSFAMQKDGEIVRIGHIYSAFRGHEYLRSNNLRVIR